MTWETTLFPANEPNDTTPQPSRGAFGHWAFWTRPELLLLFLKRQKFDWINGDLKGLAPISGSFGRAEWSWLNAKWQMQASDSSGLILGLHFKLIWFSMKLKTRKWKVTEPSCMWHIFGHEWRLINGMVEVKVYESKSSAQKQEQGLTFDFCFFCSNLHS